MNDVKTWADIDASPLLQLPPEQRKKLHDANDERFRRFWAECFLTTQASGRGEEAWNSADFCKAFLDAFDLWEPKPGQTFSMYLRTARSKKRWSTWKRTELQRVCSVVTRKKNR